MDEQCAGVDKTPEEMNPLCAIFGATIEGGPTSNSNNPDDRGGMTEAANP